MELVLKYFKIADENDCIHYISMIKLLDKSNEFPTLGKIKGILVIFESIYPSHGNSVYIYHFKMYPTKICGLKQRIMR